SAGTVETARLALAAADATRAGCRNRIIRYDCSVVRTISATTAVKRFREVLNDVEYRRETFEVERHGRPVARIGPTSQTATRRVGWKEALALLSAGPAPDPDFAADLEDVKRQIEALPEDPWARS